MKRTAAATLLFLILAARLSAALNADFLALLDDQERAFLASRSTFTVLYDPAKAPLEYVEANGTARGVSKGYIDELTALTGITFQIVSASPWTEAYQRFIDGSIDMAVALNPTEERRTHFLFTKPYLSMPIVLMAKSQVGYIDGLEAIGSRPLAIVKGYSIGEWIKRDYPQIQLVEVSSTEEGLRLVESGRAFAQTGNLMVLNHYLTTLGMTDSLKVVGTTPYLNTFSMAVQKNLAPLASIMEKALSQIDEDTRQHLYQQNLPMWYEWVIPRRTLLVILAAGSVVLLVLVLWIVTLIVQMRRGERAEQQTERSEQMFRQLFEKSPNPQILVDRTGTIIGANTQVHQLFGFPPEGLATVETLLACAYPDEREHASIAAIWEDLLRSGQEGKDAKALMALESVVTDSRGGRHTLEISATPLPDSYLVTGFDVTERHMTLGEIRRLHREAEHSRLMILSALEDQQISEQASGESRAMLDAAINSMIDAVYIIDSEGVFLQVSDAFYDYYRFSTPAQCPPSLHGFKGLYQAYDEYGHAMDDTMWVGFRALSGMSGTTEYRLHKISTDIEWYGSYNYAPIRGSEGEIIGAIVVCRDVTEERANREKLRFQRDHDYLTGLYSRVHFEELLKEMDRTLPLTLGLVDINGLKLVNDTLGNEMGDLVIKRTAQLLEEYKDEGVLIARHGGDEFVFLMAGREEDAAEAFIKRVEEAAKEITFATFHLSLSAGWACRRDLGELPAQTLRRAEEMMGRTKIYESSSAKSKSVGLLMNSLFAKSSRESLHSRRVSALCAFLAKQLELSEREINRMRTAGLMHDIGKIGISEVILNKPGRLDRSEWQEMRRHPEIGYRILSAVSEFSDLAQAILEHHERWDGSGYPQGLEGEQISYQARIIAIADSYDAMTSERSYRTPVSKEEAVEEIFNNRGILYDPQIVQVFVSTIDRFEAENSPS
ncbi:MAG: transporter substrate-binding domain-containing protein [Sphaerochaeta sp.]|nr:transporter substrate-binding domain-containing protein [Sphaerochaeta sp.]MDX9915118.1 transporter substrate-binding domain-containing protein [Sphaerochaeta sp.]